MSIFGSARDDNLPGQPAGQVTAVPVTDKQGCYNPQYPGAPVAVTFTEDDWDDHPNNRN